MPYPDPYCRSKHVRPLIWCQPHLFHACLFTVNNKIGERLRSDESAGEGGRARGAYPSTVEGAECPALLDRLPEGAKETSRGARKHGLPYPAHGEGVVPS